MRRFVLGWLSMFLLLAFMVPVEAQDSHLSAAPAPGSDGAAAPPSAPGSFDEVIDRVVEREHLLQAQMRNLRPMVETYLQNLKADASGNPSPVNDQYFLGRLDMSDGPQDVSFVDPPGSGRSRFSKLAGIFSVRFQPQGFAQMVVPDTDLYKKYYTFSFVRREFLGEVRCLVIDVQPKADAPAGRFEGRIWVEDRDYNIVRFNGTYSHAAADNLYLHFDSWRLNLRPGIWLPAYVYSEATDLASGAGHMHIKAQTRLWGYD